MTSRSVVVVGVLVVAVAAFVVFRASPPAATVLSRSPDAARSPAPTQSPLAPPLPPAAGAYDPMDRIRAGLSPGQVFLQEPRDPDWAPAAEAALGARMLRDLGALVPEARVGVTCRTLSCVIQVDAPAPKVALAMEVVKLVTLGPMMVDVPGERQDRGQVLFLGDPRMADGGQFSAWYAEAHRRTLEDIKTGKRPNPLSVPIAPLGD